MRATSSDGQTRVPRPATIGVIIAAVVVLAGIVAALVVTFAVDDDEGFSPLVTDVADPVAPVALARGGLLVAERTTGRVLRVTDDGDVSEIVRVDDDLATDGQRGVLGLAVRRRGEVTDVFASWTRASDGRLVVGKLAEDGQELIWEGPVSADLANGGTLAIRQGRVLVAVGELKDPDAVADPSTPNGKILTLDPAGGPDQVPEVLASGWHNPFAMTVTAESVWLADNAPGSDAERLVRIPDEGDPEWLELEGRRAPSGLAVLPDGDLVLCGFVSRVVERIPVPARGVEPPAGEVGSPCATGVAVLADGTMVTTTEDTVWSDPDPG